MDRPPSVVRRIFTGFFAVTILTVGSLGGYWIYREFSSFRYESDKLRQDLMDHQRQVVRAEVDKAVGFVNFSTSRLEERLRASLRERVNLAHQLATNIYRLHADTLPDQAIAQRIRETLRDLRFSQGLGYYFAFNDQGVVELYPDRPELEGTNLLDAKDVDGNYVNHTFLRIAHTLGEGFQTYHWYKPNHPGEAGLVHEKISFIKYFVPLGWVIGAGEYLDDWQTDTQREVIRGLSSVLYEQDGYLFGSTYEGVGLLGPAAGRNTWNVTDIRGKKIVQELVATAQKGGGWVDYVMPPLEGKRPLLKSSYVRGVDKWGWYIGAGFYPSDVEIRLRALQDQLRGKIVDRVLAIGLILLVLGAASLFISRYFARSLQRELEVFRGFFARAVHESQELDTNQLHTSEFLGLGKEANRMVAQRNLMLQEKKRMEAQLAQAQKMESLGTLTGGIAHDFNNIVAAILGYAELAQHKCRQGQSVEGELSRVVSISMRARSLVERILSFSRKLEYRLVPVRLNEVVAQSLDLLRRTLPPMVHIRQDLAPNLPGVMADANQLEQVLMNLASNARDAMPQGGTLTVTTHQEVADSKGCMVCGQDFQGRFVVVAVADTGHGIPPEFLSQIFEPFFTTKGVGKGTGLGLSSVFGIVSGHHGHLRVESVANKGTTFQVYLPALDQEVPREAEAAIAPAERQGQGELILLVDDEKPLLEIGHELLKEQGFRVVTAQSGEEALAIYEELGQEIDLVILDLGMPGLGGQRTLQELLKLNPKCRVLVASGYAFKDTVNDIMDLGAVGFLAKPFSHRQLTERIGQLLLHG